MSDGDIMSDQELYEQQVEMELNGLIADLVTDAIAIPCVRRLFRQPPGTWHAVEPLCHDIPVILNRVLDVVGRVPGQLKVTWLPYESEWYSKGYVTIIFFQNHLLWSNIVVYYQAQIELS